MAGGYRAFHFLHKVLFGCPIRPDLDPDDNSNTSDDDASVVTAKRKYRVRPTPEDSDSEPQMEESLLPESQQLRRPRQIPDTRTVPVVLSRARKRVHMGKADTESFM